MAPRESLVWGGLNDVSNTNRDESDSGNLNYESTTTKTSKFRSLFDLNSRQTVGQTVKNLNSSITASDTMSSFRRTVTMRMSQSAVKETGAVTTVTGAGPQSRLTRKSTFIDDLTGGVTNAGSKS